MTERSRRSFLRTTVLGGAVAGGGVLLSGGRALAAEDRPYPGPQDCGRCVMPGPGTPGPGGPGATELQLRVVNNSTQFQDFCVYQGGVEVLEPVTLAWLVEPAHPSTDATFRWTPSYDFVWGQTGTLRPGVVFDAAQVWAADPTSTTLQQVQFDYVGGEFTFVQGPATSDPQLGNLYIRELPTIPLGVAAVGIGMSGAGTFVAPAMPNMNLVFTPHPSYWVTAGTFQTGQVMDLEEISSQVEVVFPPGVSSMVATLAADNTWTVQPATA